MTARTVLTLCLAWCAAAAVWAVSADATPGDPAVAILVTNDVDRLTATALVPVWIAAGGYDATVLDVTDLDDPDTVARLGHPDGYACAVTIGRDAAAVAADLAEISTIPVEIVAGPDRYATASAAWSGLVTACRQ